MDKALISEALGHMDERYIIEALGEDSYRAYSRGKEKQNMNTRTFRKSGRIALVAAILALILSIAAGAVAYIRYERADEMMDNFAGGADYMGGSAEGYEEYETIIESDGEERIQLSELRLGWERLSSDEALLEELVYPYVADVDGSITFKDYTVTMEACIYDKDLLSGILYYTVENPKGISWEYSKLGEIWLESFTYRVGTNFGGRPFVDEERSTDTKLYICEHFVVSTLFMKEAPPQGLKIGGNDCLDFEPYLAQWENIDVPHTEFDGGNIIVAPFGMTFSKNGIGVDPGWNHQYIALRFDDGSEYVVYDRPNLFANMVCSGTNGPMRDHWSTYLFNSIIDINSVVEVQIDDAVFTLE